MSRKNGEHFFVEGVLSAVHDDEGRLLGYSKLMKDVTDKRRIEGERDPDDLEEGAEEVAEHRKGVV